MIAGLDGGPPGLDGGLPGPDGGLPGQDRGLLFSDEVVKGNKINPVSHKAGLLCLPLRTVNLMTQSTYCPLTLRN